MSKPFPSLCMDDLGTIPDIVLLPSPPWPMPFPAFVDGSEAEAQTMAAMINRLRAKEPRDCGFLLCITLAYSGVETMVNATLVTKPEGLRLIINLFGRFNGAGECMDSYMGKDRIQESEQRQAEFTPLSWHIELVMGDVELSWKSLTKQLAIYLPRLFEQTKRKPEGDPAPGELVQP